MEIRLLKLEDLAGAMNLSTSAGWNQTSGDWKRLIQLFPQTCYGGFIDGKLVASGTLVTYEKEAAWVGMILVDPSRRGGGLGKQILEYTLRQAMDGEFKVVGLDATDMGRPIYLKAGFHDVAPINRWGGTLACLPKKSSSEIRAIRLEDMDPIVKFDQSASGSNRSGLLHYFSKEKGVFGAVYSSKGKIEAYAFARPGRTAWQIGPVVSLRPEYADEIFDFLSAQFNGAEVIIDCFESVTVTRALSSRGLSLQRKLVRMTHGQKTSVLMGPSIFAATGFEYG